MRFSADLYRGTKSRPVYRPIVPDPAARAHLIVTDGRPLPAELRHRFAAVPVEVWTRPDTLPALAARVAIATAGLRLYAVGSEAFLWDVMRLAVAAGLGEGEVALHPHGPVLRRVQCIHCKAVRDEVTEPEVDCPGCGLRLLVRDHFSRRLGAFQGVALHGATRGEQA